MERGEKWRRRYWERVLGVRRRNDERRAALNDQAFSLLRAISSPPCSRVMLFSLAKAEDEKDAPQSGVCQTQNLRHANFFPFPS